MPPSSRPAAGALPPSKRPRLHLEPPEGDGVDSGEGGAGGGGVLEETRSASQVERDFGQLLESQAGADGRSQPATGGGAATGRGASSGT